MYLAKHENKLVILDEVQLWFMPEWTAIRSVLQSPSRTDEHARGIALDVQLALILIYYYSGINRWDQHTGILKGHTLNCKATDKPVAALLKDLKACGLLDQTLVLWGAEFGRTPMAQVSGGKFGRDHNPFGFTMWMAGGGVKGGVSYGATDDFGYFAVENKVHIHDWHATILHLMGLDHKRLTYRYSGRDMRLTDVHGEVVQSVLLT